MLNVIVNPNALLGGGERLLERVERRFQEAEVPYRVLRSQQKGAIPEFARALSESGERDIVAFGGDGTLNEVLTGLVHPELCRVGLIPAGTGNDFAEAARIPVGEKAVELILAGETLPTDYIDFADGRRSINIAGLGMDVDILERCAKGRGKGRGRYFRALLSSLFRYRGTQISYTVNGETRTVRAMIAALCNGRQLGGGIPLCPAAKIDDGLMDLVVVDCPKRSKLLFELLRLMRGKLLTRPITRHILCSEAVIQPAEEGYAQYDGELFPCKTLSATLVAGGVNIYRGEHGESL